MRTRQQRKRCRALGWPGKESVMSWWLLVLMTLLAGCGPDGRAGEPGMRVLPVAVMQVSPQDRLLVERRYTGLVAERSGVRLGFELPGTLSALSVDTGEAVEAGQVLARLDTRRLEAGLATARAALAEAEAAAELAASTRDRVRRAYDRDAVSAQAREEAGSRLRQAAARVDRLTREVSGLEVDLDKAALKAPFGGRIQTRFLDEGAVVSPGTPVFQLLGEDGLEIRIGIAAAVADGLATGDTLEIEAGDRRLAARIRELAPGIDPRNRTVTVVADPIGDRPGLRPGQQVGVTVSITRRDTGFWVPRSALTEDLRGLWSVYRLAAAEAGTVARQVPVEVLYFESDRAFVRGGLTPGDRIVSDGTHRLVPGQRVRPAGGNQG
ncbi:MAG: efflux RND transporter periplasmic adaptor subunit [Opitutales bacterium]